MLLLPLLAVSATAHYPSTAKLLSSGLRPIDYPQSAYYHYALARVRIVVSPKGAPERCDVLKSSGFADVDKASCLSFTGNGRFVPAYDALKNPTYGVIFYNCYWHGSRPKPGEDADLSLYLAKAPGRTLPTTRTYALSVDQSGNPSGCISTKMSASSPLDDVACAYLKKTPSIAATDRSGAPQSSVQEYSVRFEINPPSGAPAAPTAPGNK